MKGRLKVSAAAAAAADAAAAPNVDINNLCQARVGNYPLFGTHPGCDSR